MLLASKMKMKNLSHLHRSQDSKTFWIGSCLVCSWKTPMCVPWDIFVCFVVKLWLFQKLATDTKRFFSSPERARSIRYDPADLVQLYCD